MDPSEAQGVISKIGQKWKFQQRGLKDQVFKGKGGGQLNHFAMSMVADSDGALAEATSGDVHFCYLSSSIVLQQKDNVPAPPVPTGEGSPSPESPPAPPPPTAAASAGPEAPPAPAPPQGDTSAQDLARRASSIEVPHDGSGHGSSAQLRIDREE
jgi:hypothetical protein